MGGPHPSPLSDHPTPISKGLKANAELTITQISQWLTQVTLYHDAYTTLMQHVHEFQENVDPTALEHFCSVLFKIQVQIQTWAYLHGTMKTLLFYDDARKEIMNLYDEWKQFSNADTPLSIPDELLTPNQQTFLRSHLLRFLEEPDQDIDSFRFLIPSLTKQQAELIVELLEAILDKVEATKPSHSRCLHVLSYVCKSSGVLPRCLAVAGTLVKEGDNPIAGGGFADVWRGSLGDQKVAIKAIRTYGTEESETLRKSFFREVLLWRKLKHQNVLPFLGIDTTLFPLCIVSPWMEDGNMNDYLKRNPGTSRLQLLLGVTNGLVYLHSREPPIIHGDLKGDNVLIDDSGNPRLCDFGVGRYGFDTHVQKTMTLPSNAVGSARFMAPELLDEQGEPRPTIQTDVYAYGGVCLEVFTGKSPFAEKGDIQAILSIVQGEKPPRPSTEHALSDSMWDLMERCWRKDPLARPSASECHNHITLCELSDEGDPVVSPPALGIDVHATNQVEDLLDTPTPTEVTTFEVLVPSGFSLPAPDLGEAFSDSRPVGQTQSAPPSTFNTAIVDHKSPQLIKRGVSESTNADEVFFKPMGAKRRTRSVSTPRPPLDWNSSTLFDQNSQAQAQSPTEGRGPLAIDFGEHGPGSTFPESHLLWDFDHPDSSTPILSPSDTVSDQSFLGSPTTERAAHDFAKAEKDGGQEFGIGFIDSSHMEWSAVSSDPTGTEWDVFAKNAWDSIDSPAVPVSDAHPAFLLDL